MGAIRGSTRAEIESRLEIAHLETFHLPDRFPIIPLSSSKGMVTQTDASVRD